MPHIFTDKARAKELLGVHPKPQTAVTDWIQRICETEKSLNDSVLNQFIVELVEVINLQPTGSVLSPSLSLSAVHDHKIQIELEIKMFSFLGLKKQVVQFGKNSNTVTFHNRRKL